MLFSPSSAATPFSIWPWLTRLGEAQILLPLVLVACLWLWRTSERGGRDEAQPGALTPSTQLAPVARRWLFWLGAAAALTTLSKLAFIGWGLGIEALDFTGISGHAMFASAVLPMLAWTLVRGRSLRVQRGAVALAFALAALIAYSRLKVGAHSSVEAWAGLLLGSGASLLSLPRRMRVSSSSASALGQRPPTWLPAGVVAALLLLPIGAPPSRSHDLVTQLALQLSGQQRPFQRLQLKLHLPAHQQQLPGQMQRQQQQPPQPGIAHGATAPV
ncbi:phosphatase PAP2 family protein [Paucibacter sp. KCTC 42545]|uniref:phosphatase PAP2 family protein n=1 Tax=Paucibacter sp. KCTC 42545 TaxID=1768242 RepID=UPI000733C2F0|nr:phosphatase PAP2 family protein [Paucibacter sp. KCTC 42545]ALT78922.1 hypothetical protein AT984_18735 [Paucibacter sp. KCTC 42545]